MQRWLTVVYDQGMPSSVKIFAGETVPALSVGFTSGLGLLVAQISFGSFIFSGPLSQYSSQGIGLILFGNFATCLIIALLGGWRGAIAGLSPALVIVMATVGFTMNAEGETLFVTTVVALMIGAVITGLCCLVIGYFRLSNLVRFIPYPVSGGFVAGIGGTVCLAAMSLMGAQPDWRTLSALVESPIFWNWSPEAVYGIALYLAMRRWRNPLILPVSVALAVGGWHFALYVLEISGAQARDAGLLLTSTAQGNLWPALWPSDLIHVDWSAMIMQLPAISMLVLIALICVVMNFAGLEMATDQELDWNHEFKTTGLASVVSGVGGCTVATLVVPASLRSKLFGATSRLTGVVAALVIGGALLLGDGILELVPVPLVGGILIFAGLGMMDEGLIRSRKRLPWTEYSIIVLIFFAIIVFGLFKGVVTGMAAALVFFAVHLSRTDVIKSWFTARNHRSGKVRPVPDRAILMERGDRIHVYQLRGYLFFGSVCPLADRLKQLLKDASRPDCLILDFGAIYGSDFSAVNVLCRFLQTANAAGVQLVLCALPEPLKNGLQRNLPPAKFDALQIEPDTARALECCEEAVIQSWRKEASASGEQRASLLEHISDDLEQHLERQIQFEDLMESLHNWLTPCRYATGEALLTPGASRQNLQLLISGRASACDSSGARIHQYAPGDAVWPTIHKDDETTSVVAEEDCRTMMLTPAIQDQLERSEEKLALTLYRYLLAGRLQQSFPP